MQWRCTSVVSLIICCRSVIADCAYVGNQLAIGDLVRGLYSPASFCLVPLFFFFFFYYYFFFFFSFVSWRPFSWFDDNRIVGCGSSIVSGSHVSWGLGIAHSRMSGFHGSGLCIGFLVFMFLLFTRYSLYMSIDTFVTCKCAFAVWNGVDSLHLCLAWGFWLFALWFRQCNPIFETLLDMKGTREYWA